MAGLRAVGGVSWWLAAILMVCSLPGSGAESERPVALIRGLLIDGTGSEPIEDAVVLIRDGLVSAAGRSTEVSIPADAEIIDLNGGAILPGFINAHVHDGYDEANLKAWAHAGVTTVCDLGASVRWTNGSRSAFELRDRLNGDPRNARLVAAGPIVTTIGGYGGFAVSSPEDAREKVDELIDAGADVIKIAIEDNLQGRTWPLLTSEEIAAIVETAHARGAIVAAHVSRSEHVGAALDAGWMPSSTWR